MTIKPLFDKVVIQSIEAEERTASGIILPSSSKEKPQMGKIIAVGPGGLIEGKEVTMQVKVGDTILYSKYAGSEFNGFRVGHCSVGVINRCTLAINKPLLNCVINIAEKPVVRGNVIKLDVGTCCFYNLAQCRH